MKNNPNAQMQMILDAHAEFGPLPIETLSPELARQIPLPDRAAVAVYGQHFMKKALAPMPLPVGEVQHEVIGDNEVLLRIYTPKGDAPAGGWPMLVYFHGGGWVIATLDTYDSSCRALCVGAECIVVSAHYRQAPEHPWPAAVDDAVSAYEWVLHNASLLNGNARKTAVGGESAGGNLAAVVSLLMRDEGILPVHQLLIYPVTNLVDGAESPSATQYADARPLNAPMLNWFYDHYTGSSPREDFRVSPLFAADHAGLPPTTILLAEIDPLRSDGEAYAEKLIKADVPVRLQIFEGVTHEFFGLAGLVNEAGQAVKIACEDLKKSFEAMDQRRNKSMARETSAAP